MLLVNIKAQMMVAYDETSTSKMENIANTRAQLATLISSRKLAVARTAALSDLFVLKNAVTPTTARQELILDQVDLDRFEAADTLLFNILGA